MSRWILAPLMLALVTIATPVHATTVFSASGSFLVGDPFSYAVFDSCGLAVTQSPPGEQDGIDSSCVVFGADLSGDAYSATMTDASGIASDNAQVCAYGAGAFLSCGGLDGVLPAGTDSVSITTLAGVQVSWTLTVSA